MGTAASAPRDQHQPPLAQRAAPAPWAFTDQSITGDWRFLVKERVQCVCEGGRACTRESPAHQLGPRAFAGLHSSWVGGDVLAMARPWQDNLMAHDVVGQFKQAGIGMVLNLCEVGEHEGCGPGLLPASGFTYNPEAFMAARIGFYNFSWRDMGVPTLDKMLDIVQVMHYVTHEEGRKIAVHCHAGLGRTGLAIACFLVFSEGSAAGDAVARVRRCRPGALQTRQQELFVSVFEQYLLHLRCVIQVTDLRHISLVRESYTVARVTRQLSRTVSRNGSGGDARRSSSGGADLAAADPCCSHAGHVGDGRGSSDGVASSSCAGTTAGGRRTSHRRTRSAGFDSGQGDPQQAYAGRRDNISRFSSLTAERAALMAVEALRSDQAESGGGGDAGGGHALVVQLPVPAPGSAQRRASCTGGHLTLVSEACGGGICGGGARRPLHVVLSGSNVGEVYEDGLTIVRAAAGRDATGKRVSKDSTLTSQQTLLLLGKQDLGLDRPLPWNEHFHVRPDALSACGGGGGAPAPAVFVAQPPASYAEALRRQRRLLHGVERRQSLRLHKVVRHAVTALAAAAGDSAATQQAPGVANATSSSPGAPSSSPGFAQMALACVRHRGRLPAGSAYGGWAALPQAMRFGLADWPALAAAVHGLKAALNEADYGAVARAPAAAVLLVLDDWFRGFREEALGERALEALVDEAEALLQGPKARGVEPELARDEAHARLERVVAALTPADQELLRALAALLRHALFAAEAAAAPVDARAWHEGAARCEAAAAAVPTEAAAAAAADTEEAAVRALCVHCAGWLLGPLARACAPAADAVATFLWFLVADDDGFRRLLQPPAGGPLSRASSPNSISDTIGDGLHLFSCDGTPLRSRTASPVPARSLSPLGISSPRAGPLGSPHGGALDGVGAAADASGQTSLDVGAVVGGPRSRLGAGVGA